MNKHAERPSVRWYAVVGEHKEGNEVIIYPATLNFDKRSTAYPATTNWLHLEDGKEDER